MGSLKFRKFITYFICLTLLSPPLLANRHLELDDTKNPEVLSHKSQSPEYIQEILDHFQKNIQSLKLNQLNENTDVRDLSTEETEYIKRLFTGPVQVSVEIMGLLTKLHQEFKDRIKTYGESEVIDQITSRAYKNKISIAIDGVGKAELNAFGLGKNAVIFTKVVHFGANRNYIFIPPEMNIEFLEKQLQRQDISREEKQTIKELIKQRKFYIHNQVMFAKYKSYNYKPAIAHPDNFPPEKQAEIEKMSPEERQSLYWMQQLAKVNGEINGRDTTVIQIDHGQFKKEKHKRPTTARSLEWWQHYWGGIYERPTMADLNMGLTAGGLQGIISYFLGGPEIATLSVIYGVTLGIFGKTYGNWLRVSKNNYRVQIKSWFNSMSFAYIYWASKEGFSSLFAFHQGALFTHLNYIAINYANNLMKPHIYRIPFMRHKHGKNLGILNIAKLSLPKGVKSSVEKIPGIGKPLSQVEAEINLPRFSMEHQFFYLSLFGLKIAAMADASFRLIEGTNIGLDDVLLWSAIPFVERANIWYAEKNGFKEALELRKQWEAGKAFQIPYLMLIHEKVKFALNKMRVPYQGHGFYYADFIFNQHLITASEHYHEVDQRFQESRFAQWGDLQKLNIRRSLLTLQYGISNLVHQHDKRMTAENHHAYMEHLDALNTIEKKIVEIRQKEALKNLDSIDKSYKDALANAEYSQRISTDNDSISKNISDTINAKWSFKGKVIYIVGQCKSLFDF
tara:strand:- start:49752 stop:51956 length:2205 start_codon:yes stop_codon:yes gene_type:complete